MGTTDPTGTTALDLAALRSAAQRIDTVAALVLEAARTGLGGLRFDSVAAGTAHGAAGTALRAEAERLAVDLTGWGLAAEDLAAALRAGAAGAQSAETSAAAALR